MKFFGRKSEVKELREIRELSKSVARMTVVTGRRRVGKTELVRQALDDGGDMPFLYFLITRAPQSAVCENLQGEIARVFGEDADFCAFKGHGERDVRAPGKGEGLGKLHGIIARIADGGVGLNRFAA